ncbi:alpha-1,3-rhamnosyl/mannosyltransferase [Desulfobaculum xiamenense]|uniref:Alpha-1,3-rhamnosyl/mannosyltransferase n=1 Tax=Desulfobaculum xiamenense TaxID=995050 RepID=A0A846QT61_9BACT|nr:glycosyltransferase family 1 protein [Desulfobaculum xiamenense]NJB68364.1 alpha-1,3-rhamnosyl/mannosyltransferase [Desulfobaculum xiamenense]
MSARSVLVDGREFAPGRGTGISRVLEGLVDALARSGRIGDITLAVRLGCAPAALAALPGVAMRELPRSRFAAEAALALWGRGVACLLSPYAKLPPLLRGPLAVNIVHDVLNITHADYAGSSHARYARLRLIHGLRRADMTWYDSRWSLESTRELVGFAGRDPRVRHLGLGGGFSPDSEPDDESLLAGLGLERGYVLAIGNGRPHKNLGVVLDASAQFGRPLVVAGCPEVLAARWRAAHPTSRATWLGAVPSGALSALLRGAFCLVQPSLAEGYGFPPLEAMASGTPAVVSDIPVLRETSGPAALFADPRDPAQWARAVASLEARAEREARRAAGLARARELSGAAGWAGHVADLSGLLDARG